MIENGFIKMYRSLLGWEWYTDTHTKVVFLHLLLTVNYEDKKYRGTTIKRGQRACSYQTIALETNLTLQNVRTSVKHLVSTGELTYSKCRECGLFTVNNYDRFQSANTELTGNQQSINTEPTANQQATNIALTDCQQSPNIELTTMKEVKKDKKDKKVRSKEGESGKSAAPTTKKAFGEFGNVRLSDDEYAKLVQRMSKDGCADYIARLDGWLAEGHSKVNHYATIINWQRKDSGEVKQAPGKKDKSVGMIESSYNIGDLDGRLIDDFVKGGAQ